MAALGHSGLTRHDSADRGVDDPGNSWATGTNPDVHSVYLRLLAANPAIEGNQRNFAVDGSDVTGLLRQADRMGEMNPKPELILIQSIDNDMHCDGTDEASLPAYREQLAKALDKITSSAPDADILFVSQWGTVPTTVRCRTWISTRAI